MRRYSWSSLGTRPNPEHRRSAKGGSSNGPATRSMHGDLFSQGLNNDFWMKESRMEIRCTQGVPGAGVANPETGPQGSNEIGC